MNPLRGRCRTCWLAVQGFNSSHPPCQGLPWRNIIPIHIHRSLCLEADLFRSSPSEVVRRLPRGAATPKSRPLGLSDWPICAFKWIAFVVWREPSTRATGVRAENKVARWLRH